MSVPRPEYPRPSCVRDRWLCLNGPWQFEIDAGDSGLERGLRERELSGQITVPFCPESTLSGIGNVDFLTAVWYRRTVTVPAPWAGSRVLLHFQAVDYDATVWVNGVEVGRHRGGWTPFTCDLSGVAAPGETAVIVVRARDHTRQPMPSGKQSKGYANAGCHYTRTTGIWQSVWLEPVPAGAYLLRPRITPDLPAGRFLVAQPILAQGAARAGYAVRATVLVDGAELTTATAPADAAMAASLVLALPPDAVRAWSPEDPFLYDLQLELLDPSGATVDQVISYAGLRSTCVDGQRLLLNGRSVFQRLVLDQGYYPDGIMTAPTDAALVQDIELALAAGFNGARLHQKVFEERFLYHADRLGYLVWGELGDWGIDRGQPRATDVAQWLEALHRDVSHPCIVGWCGLNETHEDLRDTISPLDDLTQAVYLAAKAIDPTRPVLDASGYSHRVPESDVYDCHDYDQQPATFRARHAGTAQGEVYRNGSNAERGTHWSVPYRGQPYLVSEFGGTWWNPAARPGDPSWGYGNRPATIEEFYERFDALCAALLENPGIAGYCYTQLTDVYQEQNGVVLFDRRQKFDLARLRASQQRPAAIEDCR
ncbi:MAG: hypothetical protein IT204_16510 [Fimbriimonadaceae bacterium]|nr:hypothetical protein [Fimbriimonadaceae bacterium]